MCSAAASVSLDLASVSRGFPWRRPRREGLLLLLVAVATLTPVYVVSSQDVSRLCLSRAIAAGRLTISPCVGRAVDRSRYHGRVYSDKPPGMSLLALPAVELVDLPSASRWTFGRDAGVWSVRLLTGGVIFLALVFALGRTAEGLAPGVGGLTAVTFALGTLAGGLAATTFDEVPAAALGFAAFLLAWSRRPAVAGLVGGVALAFEYQMAILFVLVAGYVATTGVRPLLRFGVSCLPGPVLLAGYDWAAFGSPLHVSYRYVANAFTHRQTLGFFGVSLPRWHSVAQVLVGDRGLLVVSPVLVVAAAGLVLLSRTYRREALVCAAVGGAFLLLEFGYFLPYGGVSPGPRFLVPALPFLSLGLAPMFARRKVLTTALALASVVASTAVALTWSWGSALGYRQTIWGEIARAIVRPNLRLRHDLASNILTWIGLNRSQSALLVGISVLLALATAFAMTPRRDAGRRELPRGGCGTAPR
jgi:hypothetical protein